MQYIVRVLSGNEETDKVGNRRVYGAELPKTDDPVEKMDYLQNIFTFIKKQTFENNKDLDPRICKLAITLLLMGMDKTDLPFVFNISFTSVNEHVKFASNYLKQNWLKM